MMRAASLLALALAAVLAGCTTLEPVQPWQKGILSKPEMTFSGDRLDQTFTDHVYASREGASGGNGAGGGGCGCY